MCASKQYVHSIDYGFNFNLCESMDTHIYTIYIYMRNRTFVYRPVSVVRYKMISLNCSRTEYIPDD